MVDGHVLHVSQTPTGGGKVGGQQRLITPDEQPVVEAPYLQERRAPHYRCAGEKA